MENLERIDMSDKFFHSPMWDCEDSSKKLITLRKILKSGYLLSPNAQGIVHNSYDASPYDNRVFLSVYPEGKYSSEYIGNGIKKEYDGFDMSRASFYFILDSKMKDEIELGVGAYANECYLTDRLDLYKYLVGIGNTGVDIDLDFLFTYYITKCINGEIDIDELCKYLNESCFNARNCAKDILRNALHYGFDVFDGEDNNWLNISLRKRDEYLISSGYYYKIKRILEEENKDIKIYNDFGYLIDADEEFEKVKAMRKYLINGDYNGSFYRKGISEILNKM